jgi:hypothetical protein
VQVDAMVTRVESAYDRNRKVDAMVTHVETAYDRNRESI